MLLGLGQPPERGEQGQAARVHQQTERAKGSPAEKQRRGQNQARPGSRPSKKHGRPCHTGSAKGEQKAEQCEVKDPPPRQRDTELR